MHRKGMYLQPAVCQTLLSIRQSALIISKTESNDAKIDPCLTYLWLVWISLFSLLAAHYVFPNTSFLILFPVIQKGFPLGSLTCPQALYPPCPRPTPTPCPGGGPPSSPQGLREGRGALSPGSSSPATPDTGEQPAEVRAGERQSARPGSQAGSVPWLLAAKALPPWVLERVAAFWVNWWTGV